MSMVYFCSIKNRRSLVLQHGSLNGIDYLEVCTSDDPDCGCGKQLFLTLLKDARGINLDISQLRFTGGTALSQVSPVTISPATNDAPKTLLITLDKAGDFSTYNLTLVANPDTDDPPDGFDPQLSTIDFSFKAGCPTTGDCVPSTCCPPPLQQEPDINYLAKDYEAFRQVMLDRMAVTTPAWTERHPSDLGVALVEQLAYVADHLSYQQDAAATEAYLGTARSRISLRRHARLVDYRLDEGCNARTWVYLKAAQDAVAVPTGTLLFPLTSGLAPLIKPDTRDADTLLKNNSIVFATMQDAVLHTEQNQMSFYTWTDDDCCLAPGATEATLVGTLDSLQAGTVLIFQERLGPDTGNLQDADPAKRWAVRLTGVRSRDFHDALLADPLTGTLVTRIYWDAADALPFPLCLSSSPPGSKQLTDVSVALGNIVPADHGLWGAQGIVGTQWNDITDVAGWENLHEVPTAPEGPAPGMGCSCGSGSPEVAAPRARYYPELSKSPLTFARSADFTASASSFLAAPAPGAAAPAPQIFVFDDGGQQWQNEFDLLSSLDNQPVFLVEIEHDNSVFVRFGDGEYGMAPETGTSFQALYRVGNGTAGNIGHDSLAHIVTNATGISAVTNPLPGVGGADPETMEHIRQQAPYAFRSQLRAVTEDDYGMIAQQDPAIREAHGTLRWTGSWYTAFTSIDAVSGLGATPALVTTTKQRLNLFRMLGVDLDAEAAHLVGLRIEMNICVGENYFQTDVRDAIVRLFTVGNLCDGTLGLLNPQNFTFGQTIYISPFVAAAQKVDGVVSAQISVFQRMDDPSQDGSAQGFLTMGRLEIARCDNDPNRLDRGILVLHMDGGK